MTDHPLTDETCRQLWQDSKGTITDWQDPGTMTRQVMRAAADWQLKEAIKWLNENLSHYTDTTFCRGLSPMYKLKDDFKKAMRPTQENNLREAPITPQENLMTEQQITSEINRFWEGGK